MQTDFKSLVESAKAAGLLSVKEVHRQPKLKKPRPVRISWHERAKRNLEKYLKEKEDDA